jgi:hypothetical protein
VVKMTYARILGNTVVEVVTPIEGFSIEQCFHPDLIKNMVSCPTDVRAGWSYDPETNAFTAPAEPTPPEPTPQT